jgi:hypothetical protein
LPAGLEKGDRRVVVERVGVHGTHQANFVGDGAGVDEQFAELGPGVSAGKKAERGGLQGEPRLLRHHAGDPLAVSDGIGQVFIEAFAQ